MKAENIPQTNENELLEPWTRDPEPGFIKKSLKKSGYKSAKLVLIDKEMIENSDKILIEGIKKQNEKVLTELYNKFFPSIRQYIYRNNGSLEDARDIFNDAIVIILLKSRENTLNLKCSLKTYIYAICRNLWLKKLKTDHLDLVNYEEIEDTLIGAELVEEEDFNFDRGKLLFQKHFAKMSSTCRKLLGMFLDGYSFKEITFELNYDNENYARKRKYRCVKILIKRIKSDPDYKTIYDHDQY